MRQPTRVLDKPSAAHTFKILAVLKYHLEAALLAQDGQRQQLLLERVAPVVGGVNAEPLKQEAVMYVITGITGQVGSALASCLLAKGEKVRAVGRSQERLATWAKRGCDIALAEMADTVALARAFRGADGVFVLIPPNFDPSPGFPETLQIIEALNAALMDARPHKVVCLSTIGAQASEENLLSQLGYMERAVSELPLHVTLLRAAWFMENALWDVASARRGAITSYLAPPEKPFPMVSVADVGRTGAELLLQSWQGKRVVELEGPHQVSPNDIAAAFSSALGHPVGVDVVPREKWREVFVSQGMRNPEPRMRMLDGFNEGWIAFDGDISRRSFGAVTFGSVVSRLVNFEPSEK